MFKFMDIVERYDVDTDFPRECNGVSCDRDISSSKKWACYAPKTQGPCNNVIPGEPHWFTNQNDHADDFY